MFHFYNLDGSNVFWKVEENSHPQLSEIYGNSFRSIGQCLLVEVGDMSDLFCYKN